MTAMTAMTATPTRTRPGRPFSASLLAASLALASSLSSACAANPRDGYALASPYDASITTVAVPVFDNTTMRTGIEAQLTDALIKELQRETPWRVSQSETADAVIQGRITNARLIRLSQQTGVGLVQEQGVQLSVAFEFVDNRTGHTILERRGFSAIASFVPAQPSGERLSVGLRGSAELLASDIVSELANAW
ncbi:MAG: LPS assembly lipoprotein LptE [Planctomycetota bacterium]